MSSFEDQIRVLQAKTRELEKSKKMNETAKRAEVRDIQRKLESVQSSDSDLHSRLYESNVSGSSSSSSQMQHGKSSGGTGKKKAGGGGTIENMAPPKPRSGRKIRQLTFR